MEEDFGLIRPSLIRQLRAILDQYPDDGQILKELLQNAEDAGARVVKFLYDEHHHPCDPARLHHPDLAKFQGPALYAYNDATFKDEDWKGIRMLQDSIKEKDPMKVGRFGLGFKSVFHLTDLPIVLSGDRLAVIDPHEKYFKYKGQATTGYCWKLSQQQNKQLPEQLSLFEGLFGCSGLQEEGGYFEGTVFRFPLRVKASELSDTIYDSPKINALFKSFEADAHLILLFITSVEAVELYHRPLSSSGPILRFRITLSPTCAEKVLQARKDFKRGIQADQWMPEPVHMTYPLTVETYSTCPEGVPAYCAFHYLVSEYYAGGKVSSHLKALHEDPTMYNIPLVGTALPLDRQAVNESSNEDDMHTDTDTSNQSVAGHIFCILPLPVEEHSCTGLPVHVNGFFSISQNRRHLKWPTAGQAVDSDKCLLWNHCLLQELVPECYVKLILFAIDQNVTEPDVVSPDIVMAAIPNLSLVKEKWQCVLEPFFIKLFCHNIFFTEITTPHLMDLHQATIPSCHGRWVGFLEAIFNCMEDGPKTKELVKKMLLSAGVSVVDVPLHVLHVLHKFEKRCPETITPQLVRRMLREKPDICDEVSWEDRILLLNYILKDEKFPDLDGLKMLPLANQEFTFFKKGATTVYLPSEDHPPELLPGLEEQLVMTQLNTSILTKITQVTNLGCFQLCHLTKDHILKLLTAVLPNDWQDQPSITYNPENPPAVYYPERHWFHKLWAYLRLHCSNDLSAVAGLPILPIVDTADHIEILCLSCPSTIVKMSGMEITLSTPCANMLKHCGLKVVAKLPDYVESHPAVIGKYIRLPMPQNVLEALKVALSASRSEHFEGLKSVSTVQEKRELRAFLSRIDPKVVSKAQKQIVQSLPVFELCETEVDKAPRFVNLREVDRAAPVPIPPIHVERQFLDLHMDDSRSLAKIIDVQPQPVTVFLRQEILSDLIQDKYDMTAVCQIVSYIMETFPRLVSEDRTFAKYLQSVPFLPTAGGRRCPPTCLFNSDSEFLQKFFYGEDVFPANEYRNERCLRVLLQLGIRKETSIKADELLIAAQYIEKVSKNSNEELIQCYPYVQAKAEAILEYLNQNPSLLKASVKSEMSLATALVDIKWVPVQHERHQAFPQSLPWYISPASFRCPKDIRPNGFAVLVGSIMSVMEIPVKRAVAKYFGWVSGVPLALLVEQLRNVVEHYENTEKVSYMVLVLAIYDELSKHPAEEVQKALGDSLVSWVWHGDGFCISEQVVIQAPFTDLQPYIYTLPIELHKYKHMLLQCGALTQCDLQCLVQILHKIQDQLQAGKDTEDNHDRQLVIDILNYIHSSVACLDSELREDLLVPVSPSKDHFIRLNLVPVDQATYCDTEWLQQGLSMLDFKDEDGILFIDPWLSTAAAAALGVPTLMSRMLRAEELDMSVCGQSEPLTTRLQRLLEDYSDGLAVPKELIQNADDAGATEVRFLYDERTNDQHKTYLIDEGMQECQGPALWVYNNAIFTDEDFDSITKLGGATKEVHSDKIGKFGLGFNAVYNLTDVPSFVSRNYMVIFDPHTNYLGRGIRDHSRPGIKLNLKNEMLVKKLPDQFQPFQGVFGFCIGEKSLYDATLFRLPLRTQSQASKSDISSLYYNNKEMKQLLQMIIDMGSHLLLFTQNVRVLKVFHLADDGKEPHEASLVFHTEKQVMKIVRPLSTKQSAANPSEKSREACTNSHPVCCDLNMLRQGADFVHQRSQSENASTDDEVPAVSFVMQLATKVTKKAHTLLNVRALRKDFIWLISHCAGNKKALELSLDAKSHKKGLNPMAGVAIALVKKDNGFLPVPLDDLNEKGMFFCYLPLPIENYLPVHINGAFAVQSSRRHLITASGDDKDSFSAQWNEAFLQDAVCRAYIQAIYDVNEVSAQNDVEWYKLWPSCPDGSPNIEPLVSAICDHIVNDENMPVCSKQSRVITMREMVLMNHSLSDMPTIKDCVEQTFRDLKQAGMMVPLPEKMIETLSSFGHSKFLLKKTYDIQRFFKEVFIPNIANLSADVRDALVLYALGLNQPAVDHLLRDSCCIPVSPDGSSMKQPHELVHPQQFTDLYTAKDGYFPHGAAFLRYGTLTCLERLGMDVFSLSSEKILERAMSLAMLATEDGKAASDRLVNLLHVLDQNLKCEKDKEDQTRIFAKLTEIEMFSPKPKPASFPLPWKGDEYAPGQLLKASDVYLQVTQLLISSTQPIISIHDYDVPKNVQKALGLRKDVSIDDVLTQLNYAMEVKLASAEKDTFAEMYKLWSKICNCLQEKCAKDCNTATQISRALQSKECILVKDKFRCPKSLSFSEGDYPPYLYCVPFGIGAYLKDFLKLLGVSERFTIENYVWYLQQLHEDTRNAALSEEELKSTLSIVSQLNACMKEKAVNIEELRQSYGNVYIPNVAGKLKESTQLCFNDYGRVKITGTIDFTHRQLMHHHIDMLGIRTMREEAITSFGQGIPFGQKEPLTCSLKRILRNYPCDVGILYELIQNADDAQATEIHFVVDPRHHGTKCIFEKSWEPMQGPALCVYNNRPFTAKDLKGIQQLGEGSKASDPSKTGQYGIGFSSVYHLTDAPSFLTCGPEFGEMLCVLDPHCRYMPGATQAEPGMSFSDLDIMRDAFPDIFSCYLEDIIKTKDATLFRLPLRTKEMAEQSEISSKAISIAFVQDLLKELKEEAKEVLLFTNHLKRITFSAVNQTHGHLVQDYSAWIELRPENEAAWHHFQAHVEQCAAHMKRHRASITQISQEKMVFSIDICDSDGQQEMWAVAKQIGVQSDAHVPESVDKAFHSGDLMLLPQGGTACLLKKRIPDTKNRVKQSNVFCFLPLPTQSSLPVHLHGHFALSCENRRQICSSNQDGPAYKTDWNLFLSSEVIAVSYLNLILFIRTHIVCPPMENNIDTVNSLFHYSLRGYFGYFPRWDNDQVWSSVVKGYYQKSEQLQLEILPALRENSGSYSTNTDCSFQGVTCKVMWFTLTTDGPNKVFLKTWTESQRKTPEGTTSSYVEPTCSSGKEIKQRKKHSKPEKTLETILLNCNYPLIVVAPGIIENYSKADIKVNVMTPESVLEFFQNYTQFPSSAPISNTPFQERENLEIVLQYCAKAENFPQKLQGTPLLLTRDACLRTFSVQTPVFNTQYSDLLPACRHVFLHQCMRKHFSQITEKDTPVFSAFTIKSLSERLQHILPENYYRASGPVPWSPDTRKGIGRKWIRRLWSFIMQQIEDGQHLSTVLETLKDWSILPAKQSGGTYYLFPLKNATDVILLTSSMSKAFKRLLEQLDVPWLANDCLEDVSCPDFLTAKPCQAKDWGLYPKKKSIFGDFVTTFDCPQKLLKFLYSMVTQKQTEHQHLTLRENSFYLLHYFSERVKQLDRNCQEMLRALPCYEIVFGDRIALTNCLVYVVPHEVPEDDMDVWKNKQGTVFLKGNDTLKPLYSFLNCKAISFYEIYCQFIFQHFEYLSSSARGVHLYCIHNLCNNDSGMCNASLTAEERKDLLERLKVLEVIEDKSGELRTASSYHDPENGLFRSLLPKEQLAPDCPQSFPNRDWLGFLRSIGLQTQVTELHVHTFAFEIARDKHMSESSANYKSKRLTEHLLKMQNPKKEEILKSISMVAFLSPFQVEQRYAQICRQFGDEGHGPLPFVAFNQCFSSDYLELVWTRAPLLPDWADPTKVRLKEQDSEKVMQWLGVSSKPPIRIVICHLLTLSELIRNNHLQKNIVWKRDRQRQDTIKVVFRSIYQFLQDTGLEGDEVQRSLEDQPCVLVESCCQFTLPCQVATNMCESDEIRPYLYKVPVEFGEFSSLFHHLGSSSTPTFDQFASVLEQIHSTVGDGLLTAPEMASVFKAVNGIFNSLEKSPSQKITAKCLFLPSVDGCLIDSSKLILNDMPHYSRRVHSLKLKFLFNIKECFVRSDNIGDLIKHLPVQFRPNVLSSKVEEVLVDEASAQLQPTGVARKLSERLTCQPFMHAVMRLIRHESHKSGRKMTKETEKEVVDCLSTVKVYSGEQLQTQLKYKGQVVPHSHADKTCFVQKISGRIDAWNVFILSSAQLDNDLLIPLAEVINSLLNGLLCESSLYLLHILACSEDQIEDKLNALSIRLDQSEATNRQVTLPPVGSLVSDCHLHLLDRAIPTFTSGDYIVYKETENASAYYAMVKEHLPVDQFGEWDEPSYIISLGNDKKDIVANIDTLFCLQRK